MANIFRPSASGSSSASSGTGKNYLGTVNSINGNGDFELGTTSGWSLGTVSLTSGLPTGAPTFGSGASGNLALTATGSGKLAGSYSGQYASSAATTAGNFLASDAFTIDTEDQAKVMTFKFYYSPTVGPTTANWSGTSSNSFGVAIYDVTASAWIIPAGVFGMTQSAGVGYVTGTFQTTSSSTSYRLVMYNANATSGAITLLVDDFFLGPQTAPFGPAVTDWVAYTPTGSWVSNTTYTGFYRRIGDSLEVLGRAATSGAPTTATLTVNLPSGFTIDTTKLVGSTAGVSPLPDSVATANDTGVATFLCAVFYSSTTAVRFNKDDGDGTIDTAVNQASPFTFGAGDSIEFSFKVPIVGLSSNVQMSNDTDTRVVAMQVTQSAPTATITGSVSLIKFTSTPTADTHGGFSTSTGLYTVQVTGFYRVTASLGVNATYALNNSTTIGVGKNSSTVNTIQQSVLAGGAEGTLVPLVTGTIFCNAGDTLAPTITSTGTSPTINSPTAANYFHVERLSGPSVVAATESVSARCNRITTTQITPVLTTFSFLNVIFDSHGGYDTASGFYKIPVSGKYRVSSGIGLSAITLGSANLFQLQLLKSATIYTFATVAGTGGAGNQYTCQFSDTLSCVAGETLAVQVRTGITSACDTGNGSNWFAIERIGN